ncbi:Mitochondrial acidic protein mam33 [Tieghemiomyces parasiticus]|uniref:Mitochondrial acidic protein mam33 n=1 Tax=Tieghemiomyces parasiticus TaxID=78921 RepID=A0A9W8DPP5_9FUNG|nr:Mitochondrial acidic protein mam33 [Tieghemiomyces parasiticus]
MLRNLRLPAFRSATAAAWKPTTLRQASRLAVSPATSLLKQTRALSVSGFRASQGLADKDLAHCLDSELSYELENQGEKVPDFLESFLEKDLFKVKDVPGQNEVALIRTFGTETITVTFSIAEIHNAEDMMDNELDNLDAETTEAAETSGSARQSSSVPEAADEANEEDDEDMPLPENNYPVRFNVTVEKPGTPVLSFDLTAEDGDYGVDHICVYRDAKTARTQTAEADYARRGHYLGPNFGFLDDDLKSAFETYLEERGIDSSLAIFIPDYIEYKEQGEYVRWLKDIKKVIEA